jgi:hypothetical protein
MSVPRRILLISCLTALLSACSGTAVSPKAGAGERPEGAAANQNTTKPSDTVKPNQPRDALPCSSSVSNSLPQDNYLKRRC